MSFEDESNFTTINSPLDSNFLDFNNLNNEEKKDEKIISSNSNSRKRFPFTKEEDKLLLDLVQFYGLQKKSIWNVIASHMKGRNVRQCRERYQLFLNKNANKNEKWTIEEDNILLSKFPLFGPHWKKYEPFFVGRTSYNIKNRFRSLSNPKRIIKNTPNIRKSNQLIHLLLRNQKNSEINKAKNQNQNQNEMLKKNSLVSFSKEENQTQNLYSNDNDFLNNENELTWFDEFSSNEYFNLY